MQLTSSYNMTSPRRPCGVSLSAMALGLAALVLPLLPATVAKASDLDYTQTMGAQSEDNSFLRIGNGKTAVLKLPAIAKDVIVGDPNTVDVVVRNKNTAYLFGRQPGQTNIFFFDANGQEILHLDLEVTLDGKGVKKLIDRAIPGNAIKVDTTGGSVVLSGTAANAAEAKLAVDLAAQVVKADSLVVNAMDIAGGDQVMLKVRVVELKRTILKQLGVNTTTNLSIGNFGFRLATGGNGANFRGNYSSTANLTDSFSARVDIDALEAEGLATTLAEPTLTAISGATANFNAGGEIPYRSVCTAGNTTYACTAFKPYGVSLNFSPTVLSEGRIGLQIRTEVSEIGATVGGEPSIDTRNAETSVEIPSGGSMMLAGLIKDVTKQDLSGTPGLRKLPILGALFNSRSYQKNQSELVVIVTPYVVNPTHASKLATPIDRLNAPTDRQAILFGRLNKTYGTPGKNPNGVYHGKVGYIIE